VTVVGKNCKKNKKETAIYKRRNKTKTQNAQNRKHTHTQKKKTNIQRFFFYIELGLKFVESF
jgi:hypothetical protein